MTVTRLTLRLAHGGDKPSLQLANGGDKPHTGAAHAGYKLTHGCDKPYIKIYPSWL